jgi:thiol-disulfide isomerase/thioredoxin
MRKITVIFALSILIISCTNQEEDKQVIINGKILSENVKEVKFSEIITNPIVFRGLEYITKVDSSEQFSINIPIERLVTGRIAVGNSKHSICLLPGDEYFIEIDSDTISYKGKGAEKNNFLYATEKNATDDKAFKSIARNKELSPTDFVKAMKDFKQRRLDFLDAYPNKNELEPEFMKFYKIQTQVIYENQMRNYVDKNETQPDSPELNEEYLKLYQLSNIMDDPKVISAFYIAYLNRFLSKKGRKMSKKDTSLKYADVIHSLLIDSLRGKTQEFILASRICDLLAFNSYDTLLLNKFKEIEKDSLASRTVNMALNKYYEKQALIGQPLHPAFAETLLADTANNQLSFGEMMNKYKGNVVFLDIWALSCGPCRATKPHERKMNEHLSGLPIEFVYITEDSFSEDLWEEIFKTSLTKQNHYRMINNRGSSKLTKFMNIYYVPCYMIFDKQGNLIDFMADKPNIPKIGESKLEKTLKELAKK